MSDKIKVIDNLEITPSSEYILVKVDQEELEKTSGGIIIPRAALANKKTQTGTITAVGRGRRDPQDIERRIPMDCKVGERILFACYIGYPMVINNVEHVLIKYNDIMGRVQEDFHYAEGDEVEDIVTNDQARFL